MAKELHALPEGTDVVIRALPPAGKSDFSALERDIKSGIAKYLERNKSKNPVR